MQYPVYFTKISCKNSRKSDIIWPIFQGTATLYKNKSSGGLVIIKEISTQELSPTERQFAVNEANVLKIMDHPNIIRYECNFEIEGNLHLMMEYADGGSLSQYVSVN